MEDQTEKNGKSGKGESREKDGQRKGKAVMPKEEKERKKDNGGNGDQDDDDDDDDSDDDDGGDDDEYERQYDEAHEIFGISPTKHCRRAVDLAFRELASLKAPLYLGFHTSAYTLHTMYQSKKYHPNALKNVSGNDGVKNTKLFHAINNINDFLKKAYEDEDNEGGDDMKETRRKAEKALKEGDENKFREKVQESFKKWERK